MKKIKIILKAGSLIFLVVLFLSGCSAYESQSDVNDVSQAYNLDELSLYGEWVHIDNYGTVWHPYVVSSWMPFEYGHWAFADANWTWISYEPFGWIVYHYGFWYDDPFYGWVWIPGGDNWSPANVLWCSFDNYIGWAPLPPPGVAYKEPWEKGENRHWRVVESKNFTEDDIRNYNVINPSRNETGERNVIDRNPPDRIKIAKFSNKSIPEIKLRNEAFKMPERYIQKMNLPQQERKRVEQHAQQVRNTVLVPRNEFHSRREQVKQQHVRK